MGLAFHRGKNQRGYWETDEIERPNSCLKYFCKKNKLSYTEINTAFLRSNDYRKQWLEANKGFHGIYFCMYCGRPMTLKTLTIDHIFPCDRSSKSPLLQFIISKTGIYDINDIHNLGPCCRHCNSKKGSKVNLYYMLAACVGKRPYGFIIRWSIRLLIFIILVFVLI